MYVCGNTVYDFCHIGHARAMISFDIYFTLHSSPRVTNWIIVRKYYRRDDKSSRRAEENNESTQLLTERMIAAQREDELRLGNKMPDREPKRRSSCKRSFDMDSNPDR